MRIPEPAPLGETFAEAGVLGLVAASLVNGPAGGCVESVVTRATQRRVGFLLVVECRAAISTLPPWVQKSAVSMCAPARRMLKPGVGLVPASMVREWHSSWAC